MAIASQTPTLIGCMFLMNRNQKFAVAAFFLLHFAAISEALNSSTILKFVLNFYFLPLSLHRLFKPRCVFSRAFDYATIFLTPASSSAFSLLLTARHLAAAAVISEALNYAMVFYQPASSLSFLRRCPSGLATWPIGLIEPNSSNPFEPGCDQRSLAFYTEL